MPSTDDMGTRPALLILALIFCAALPAQTPPTATSTATKVGNKDPLNRDSPQSTVFSFLEACHARDFARASRYLDLRKMPEGQRLTGGVTLVQQLQQILDRDSQFDVANLSRNSDGNDGSPNREQVAAFNVNGQTLDLVLERVVLHSGLSVWLFDPASVDKIPQIALMISSSPIEKHLPVFFVEQTVLDTSLWRWAALALIAIALAALSKLLTRLALLLAEPIIRRTAPNMSRGALEIFIGPLRLLLAVALFRGGVEAVGPSALVRLYFLRGLTLLFMLALFWLCAGLVDLVLGRLSVSMQVKHRTFTHSVLPLASRVTKLTILLLMITAVLGSWGYKTTTILAGLGVGGLAIALAAQKTIENLFGGVAVISDRLVSVGDFCKSGPLMGTVEDIGLRSTRLRTPDRTLLTVPNGQFSSMTIENFNKRDKILFHLMLNLRRDTTPDQVRTLLHAITDILTHHRKLEPGTLPVRFVGVGTYSLDLEVFAYVLTQDGDEFLQIQQDLLLKILDTIESAGTALALPTQASINYAVDRGRQQKGPLASQSPADSERSLSKNSS